jgi:hypothetical protein
MSVHVGNRVKYLVEKKYKGTKKEFSAAIGLKNENYVFQLFHKENLSTKLLSKIGKVLNMEITEIVAENMLQVNEPESQYITAAEVKELQILRQRVVDLERIIKMQDKEIADCNSKLTETLKLTRKHT